MGVEPTEPGIALRFSRPHQPSATVRATSSSHSIPAPAVSLTTPSAGGATCQPVMWFLMTHPATPASATNTLLPPPKMVTGSAGALASASAPCSSAWVVTVVKYSAAPPVLKVVYGASG